MRLGFPFHSHHMRLVAALIGQFAFIQLLTIILWFWGPPQLPLWYSLVTPSEQLAPKIMVTAIPALATFILLTALWFGRKTALEHERYLATLGPWTGIFLQGFLAVALLRIMKIVL